MRNIVICGSMKVKDKIIKIGKELEKKGHKVFYPTECFENKPKEIASKAHFDRISSKESDTILIINEKAHGKENYIGPNSFAEIAFGFYFKKDIYLLNDIYEPYIDELSGWHVKTLKGKIDKL